MTVYQYLNQKQINFKLTGIILGVLIIGAVFLVSQEFLSLKKEIDSLEQMEAAGIESIARQITQKKVLYKIDFGEEEIKSYWLIPSETSTVFSLLEELAKKENLQLEWKLYAGMGVFVESIDGVKNGMDNKYWQYWLNGELPMVAADKKLVKNGDKVEWKFTPSTF